jgi:apolipoprotein N-acyltransferase
MVSDVSHSALKTYLYPVLAGACIFLGFEPLQWFPLLLLWPLFLRGMRQLPTKKKLLSFWIMAISANLGGYYWIVIVAQDHGGLPWYGGVGVLLLYSMFNNLNFVLWAYLERFFGERSSPFITAALFVVAEQINPQVFPWYFGAGLDSVLVLYQTADLWGVMGLSFVAVAILHIPYWAWDHRRSLLSSPKLAFVRQLAFVLFVVFYGVGALRRYNNDPAIGKKFVAISLVQTNTTLEKFYGATLSTQERLTEFLATVGVSKKALSEHQQKVDLLIWPEGSVHFPILNYEPVFNTLADLSKRHQVYLTAGSAEVEIKKRGEQPKYYNTQFVLNREGEIAGKYRKIVLLAFGEYIPFLETFPDLEKWLPSTISHFTRGTEKPIFALDDSLSWLPLICYEDIISGFIAGFDHRRADFMVNITNDGWFGKSSASFLHKQMARPRAVEYRKPLARCLNTGSSQVIDPAGRTVSRETALYSREFINVTLNVPQTPPVTVYSMVGNCPVYGLIAVVVFLWARKKFWRKKN